MSRFCAVIVAVYVALAVVYAKPPPSNDYPRLSPVPPPSVTPKPTMRTVTRTNHVPPLPGQTNETVQTVTRSVALPAVVAQPSTNPSFTRGLVLYIPPNGTNSTNRQFVPFAYSHDGVHWAVFTNYEKLSGYYVTNNVRATNLLTLFRTGPDWSTNK